MKYTIALRIVMLFCLAGMALARAYPYPMPDELYGHPAPVYEPKIGRVKMQVYRGPSKGQGYDTFAPWGFYVTQPLDKAVSYGYH